MPGGDGGGESDTQTMGRGDLGRLSMLVRAAFAQAKDAGKEDWHRMYAGVLKNRILLITAGDFDEAEWGMSGFTSLLALIADDVRVDRSAKLPVVELLHLAEPLPPSDLSFVGQTEHAAEHPSSATQSADSKRWRIRRDLWDAVLGVRDPEAFMWAGGAVVRVPQDHALDPAGPRLPTLTGPELDAWQTEFASELPTDSRFATVLRSWARGDIGTAALPRQLQHQWYARLKRQVRDRLEAWFAEHGLAIPVDLIEVPSGNRSRVDAPDSDLRALVVACVRGMTEEELRVLSLPAGAVLRASRR